MFKIENSLECKFLFFLSLKYFIFFNFNNKSVKMFIIWDIRLFMGLYFVMIGKYFWGSYIIVIVVLWVIENLCLVIVLVVFIYF